MMQRCRYVPGSDGAGRGVEWRLSRCGVRACMKRRVWLQVQGLCSRRGPSACQLSYPKGGLTAAHALNSVRKNFSNRSMGVTKMTPTRATPSAFRIWHLPALGLGLQPCRSFCGTRSPHGKKKKKTVRAGHQAKGTGAGRLRVNQTSTFAGPGGNEICALSADAVLTVQ